MARENNNFNGGGGAGSSVTLPQNPALDPLSVYYIHPGENPSMTLTTPLLSVKNYHSWARAMKHSLISKNKFKFVNGTMQMPTSFDPSFDAWERCNNLVLSWIFNFVEPQIAQSVVYLENAVAAWKLLKTRIAQEDRVRIFELQQELTSMKQGSNSVTQYFTEITILWEELDNYRLLPDCTCVVACLCETGKNGKIYKNEDYIMKFLSGLNDEFEVVKTQILMMEPFPDIDKTYSLVI
uniref:Retrotransposon Copia-like N-terminal domain-containing protein n=1 Tax=Cajanus cajan TaxID=3821 RepID=A0A151RUP9_CAJCA|nr:hypothetical protein KK1_032139 [Cajanus cajan]